jgi:hypothetical protein
MEEAAVEIMVVLAKEETVVQVEVDRSMPHLEARAYQGKAMQAQQAQQVDQVLVVVVQEA